MSRTPHRRPGGLTPGRRRLTYLLVSWVSLALPGTGRCEEVLSPGSFLSEYRAAMKARRDEPPRFQVEGTYHEVFDRHDGQPPFRDDVVSLKYAIDPLGERWGFSLKNPGYLERVLIRRKAGKPFGLRRGSPGGAYSLEFLDKIPDGVRNAFKPYSVGAASSIGDQSMIPIAEAPGFTVKRATRASGDGGGPIRVEFEYHPADPKNEYDMVGEMTLDPTRGMAIRSYSVARRTKGIADADRFIIEETGTVAYPEAGPCRLVPSTVDSGHVGRFDGNIKLETRREFRVDRCSNDPTPEAEFQPAYYGLGALDEVRTARGNHTARWAFGVAAAALVLTILLKRMAR